MKRVKEQTTKSCNITEQTINTFTVCYKRLEKGQKQNLHRLIISQLQIPYKEVTIRAYCTNFYRIPEEKQPFFIKLMMGSIITLYNQLTDQWSEQIKLAKNSIDELSKTLELYGKECR